MLQKLARSRLASASLISSVLLIVAGMVAFASIPDSAGVIHGCYVTKTGALRVIDSPAQTCVKGEIAISWNQVGPQGPQGIQGIQGIPGTNGLDGKGGTDGVSVASAPLALDDPNCPYGGSQFTAVTGVTYACNGAPGTNGTNGTNGAPGTNGTSVTSTPLAVNDPNCSNGGSAFTSANGTTYACNGAAGPPGPISPVSYYTNVNGFHLSSFAGGLYLATASCNNGDSATGGGYGSLYPGVSVVSSLPSNGISWSVNFNLPAVQAGSAGLTAEVDVVCAHQT